MSNYLATLGRAFGMGIVCAAFFHLFRWEGFAVLAVIVLYEIAAQLGEIRDKLNRLPDLSEEL